MNILGIETSCDDTSASIICDNNNPDERILSNVIETQISEHSPYGGVVPEIASRCHINKLPDVIKTAMSEAECSFDDIDAIAVTAGPGLIGGVIVGVMMAKAISSSADIPIIAVNHLEGHALTARLTDDVSFPYLLLLISGGHCQILIVENAGKYELIGKTIDDALGEAFDKTAKMLGLGYPGGPIVEQRALNGDKKRFKFPRPLINRQHKEHTNNISECDFSFSGLKTAVLRQIEKIQLENGSLTEQDIDDICASFQFTCGDIITNRMERAINIFRQKYPDAENIVIAGGVSANQYLKSRMDETAKPYNMKVFSPPLKLCTDNAAMIAWAGLEKIKLNPDDYAPMDFIPRARWSLVE